MNPQMNLDKDNIPEPKEHKEESKIKQIENV